MNSMKHNSISIYVQKIREFLTKLYVIGATPRHKGPGDGSLLSNSLHLSEFAITFPYYFGNI